MAASFSPGGVYAAWARVNGGEPLAAVMNLGPQPTVDPTAPSALEVHLLGQQLELEGSELSVQPVALLRRQQKFGSLEALCAQIAADAQRAGELLAARSPEAGSLPMVASAAGTAGDIQPAG